MNYGERCVRCGLAYGRLEAETETGTIYLAISADGERIGLSECARCRLPLPEERP